MLLLLGFFTASLSANPVVADENDDGQPDQWLETRDGIIIKMSLDRNFDSMVDYRVEFDDSGRRIFEEGDFNFDGKMDADHAAGDAAAQVSGAKLVRSGKWGGAVDLSDNQSLSFDAPENLDMSAGTMMFWIKPNWQAPTEHSHTILSMGLDGDPPGYMVLSQGWWETGGGAARTRQGVAQSRRQRPGHSNPEPPPRARSRTGRGTHRAGSEHAGSRHPGTAG